MSKVEWLRRKGREKKCGIFVPSLTVPVSGFGGAEVPGSNPAEVVGFLKGDKKSSERLPSEGK